MLLGRSQLNTCVPTSCVYWNFEYEVDRTVREDIPNIANCIWSREDIIVFTFNSSLLWVPEIVGFSVPMMIVAV